jgi:hypothetical protein
VKQVKMVDLMAQLRGLTEPTEITAYGKVIATLYPRGTETVQQVGMECGHEPLIAQLRAQVQAQSHADVGAVICLRVTEYLRARSLMRHDQSLTYADGKVILRSDGTYDGPSFGHPTAVPKPTAKPKENRYGR